jgi:hypothetical protein
LVDNRGVRIRTKTANQINPNRKPQKTAFSLNHTKKNFPKPRGLALVFISENQTKLQ